MDDTKAIESLTHELSLSRLEQAALVDALNASRHGMKALEEQTRRLADLIEAGQARRGFWRRIAG